jgi:hypothetical protein
MAGGRGPAPEPGWRIERGRHELHVGTSVSAIHQVLSLDVTS